MSILTFSYQHSPMVGILRTRWFYHADFRLSEDLCAISQKVEKTTGTPASEIYDAALEYLEFLTGIYLPYNFMDENPQFNTTDTAYSMDYDLTGELCGIRICNNFVVHKPLYITHKVIARNAMYSVYKFEKKWVICNVRTPFGWWSWAVDVWEIPKKRAAIQRYERTLLHAHSKVITGIRMSANRKLDKVTADMLK